MRKNISLREDWLSLRNMADRLLKNAKEEKRALRLQIKALFKIVELCSSRIEDDRPGIFFGINDALYTQAFDLVCAHQNASASWLHRKLGVSYRKAARLIEAMERESIVGPPNHVGRREVLRDEAGRPL